MYTTHVFIVNILNNHINVATYKLHTYSKALLFK